MKKGNLQLGGRVLIQLFVFIHLSFLFTFPAFFFHCCYCTRITVVLFPIVSFCWHIFFCQFYCLENWMFLMLQFSPFSHSLRQLLVKKYGTVATTQLWKYFLMFMHKMEFNQSKRHIFARVEQGRR